MNEKKIPVTERNNPRTLNIDKYDTMEILRTIHLEDIRAYEAVGCQLKKISEIVDKIYKKFSEGGRVIYVGAGTSGRLGAQDAIEMWPTYGFGKDKFDYVIAGGDEALKRSIENAEDIEDDAIRALKEKNIKKNDSILGISASGLTPFVYSAVNYPALTDWAPASPVTLGLLASTAMLAFTCGITLYVFKHATCRGIILCERLA
ncbi:MAG: N-acetylmuramic acid 6-phosphate etherase [Thermoplasmata archaeon]